MFKNTDLNWHLKVEKPNADIDQLRCFYFILIFNGKVTKLTRFPVVMITEENKVMRNNSY